MAIQIYDHGAVEHHDPNELLRRLVSGFLAGYKGNTRDAYQTDLKNFLRWCEDQELHPLQAARGHIELYLRGLEALGRQPATVARRCSTLSKFYEYVVDEEILERSPTTKVRRPKVPEDSPVEELEEPEYLAFMAAAEADSPAVHALMCLYAYNGLRCSEPLRCDVTDLGVHRGQATLRVRRKGGKIRLIPLDEVTIASLEATIGERRVGRIFLDRSGGLLSRQQAYRVVRRIAKAAGITKKVHPHMLRHAFVTIALDHDIPLHVVQDAAGHADPRTTQRYNRRRHQFEGHPTFKLAHLLHPETAPEEAPPA